MPTPPLTALQIPTRAHPPDIPFLPPQAAWHTWCQWWVAPSNPRPFSVSGIPASWMRTPHGCHHYASGGWWPDQIYCQRGSPQWCVDAGGALLVPRCLHKATQWGWLWSLALSRSLLYPWRHTVGSPGSPRYGWSAEAQPSTTIGNAHN